MTSTGAIATVAPESDHIPAQSVIKLSFRDGAGVFHPDWPIGRIDDALNDKAGLVWVDILGADELATTELQDWLCNHFQFHHLAVEDALAESHIAKIDDWGDYLYIVFHVARIEPEIRQARSSGARFLSRARIT